MCDKATNVDTCSYYSSKLWSSLQPTTTESRVFGSSPGLLFLTVRVVVVVPVIGLYT
jgi:hypothetical protein